MKIDLHFHGVRKKKSDWLERLSSMMAKAAEEGLGAVALLDHDYHPTCEDVLLASASAPGVRIFRAVEFSIKDNCRRITDHLVVISDAAYGWDISRGITTAELPLLRNYVACSGALTILAHPFRRHPNLAFDFHDLLPDAVEVASPSVPPECRWDVMLLAARWGMALVENSDSHRARHVGRFFMTVPDWAAGSLELLKAAVKSGACVCNALAPSADA
jgi:hypothetical protein